MKWIAESRTLELSERNSLALLRKLDDPLSARMLRSPCQEMIAHAVEDTDAAADPAAVAAEGVVEVTRSQLRKLLDNVGATVDFAGIRVVAVPDSDHYGERAPGEIFMPTSGERY
jgi:hypothetical protein